ncbi:MAG: NAD(P)H-dependent oxidoreductase [Flavobacteriaceae bacterium]|nr:NAD(P)H-dependent oxidoreductase [Flavobacteriaceae bacterium]
MSVLESLKWRYATKSFDKSKKIKKEDLEKIKEAVRLSATSYGLQLFKVLIIENDQTREELKPFSYNQTQITDSDILMIFCSNTQVKSSDIDDYIKLKSETENINIENLKGYADFMKAKLTSMTPEKTSIWTQKQTYLALSNLLTICGELQIDTCPIEGFESEKYNEVLGLDSKGLYAAVAVSIGYRSEDDKGSNADKVRKTNMQLFETIS